jgi:hypothetical protein
LDKGSIDKHKKIRRVRVRLPSNGAVQLTDYPSMSRTARDVEPIEIELMRGGDVVSTLTGAFGQSLQETRLTAMLGYLIALNPRPFLNLFGFRGVPQRVCLEKRHDEGRSDILVETNIGKGIIEAKVDATDPLVQSQRYPARWISA